MCNLLHEDSQPIPETGIGWKLFRKGMNGQLLTLSVCNEIEHYCFSENESVKWNDSFKLIWGAKNVFGFCFLLTEELAREVLIKWAFAVAHSEKEFLIARIEYKGGLGKHTELEFLGSDFPVEIALCKEFKVLDILDV